MFRRLYNWTMDLSGKRHALWALAAVSWSESFVFPIPPDVMMVPMILARRERAWMIATVASLASVLGGLTSWLVGYYFFESVGRDILDFYGHLDNYERIRDSYNLWGVWIILGGALTPFPYKVIAIASGVTQLDWLTFVWASLLGRSLRFFLEAALLWRFGEHLRQFIERYLGWLVGASFVFVVGGLYLAGTLF